MGTPEEGHQVVLALRLEVDVADEDHLVVVDVEERARQDLGRILRIAPS